MRRGLFRGIFMAALVCLGASYLPARGADTKAGAVYALFDFERSESFRDFPYPSDAFYRPGRGIDLAGFPAGLSPLSRKVVNNYVDRLGDDPAFIPLKIMFEPSEKYDSRYCTWREEAAYERLDQLLSELGSD